MARQSLLAKSTSRRFEFVLQEDEKDPEACGNPLGHLLKSRPKRSCPKT